MKAEEPFCCIRCGKAFGVRSTIERVTAKLADLHWMFKDPKRLEAIKMCDNCRVAVISAEDFDPYGAPPRPPVRTTEDYLREREQKNEAGAIQVNCRVSAGPLPFSKTRRVHCDLQPRRAVPASWCRACRQRALTRTAWIVSQLSRQCRVFSVRAKNYNRAKSQSDARRSRPVMGRRDCLGRGSRYDRRCRHGIRERPASRQILPRDHPAARRPRRRSVPRRERSSDGSCGHCRQ